VTGKLSDLTGLLFFPLLATAAIDCLLLPLSRLGARVDFTLRSSKVAASIAITAAIFSAIKLSAPANQAFVDLLDFFGLSAQVVLDPTDLLALPILWIPWRIGRWEISRVPLGRVELILRRHARSGVVASDSLHDIVPAGADPAGVRDLAEALDAYLENSSPESAIEVESKLAKLRDP
jgi:hypothetical protein